MRTWEEFKDAMQQKESRGWKNPYQADNKRGFYGKYQFGIPRLRDFGFKGTPEQFKNNPQLQEEIFLKHVQDHAKYLQKYLIVAKKKFGDWVTLSGLIGGAHLKGRGREQYVEKCSGSGVIQYILYGKDCPDGNGTLISEYVKFFSGYDIPNFKENIYIPGPPPVPNPIKRDNTIFIVIAGIVLVIILLKNRI